MAVEDIILRKCLIEQIERIDRSNERTTMMAARPKESPIRPKLSAPDVTMSTPLQESSVKLASELQHEVISTSQPNANTNANADASSSTSSANEMTASLSYNNRAYVNAETNGNAGEFLGAVLVEMSSQAKECSCS
eukprot:scaffold11292_cov67-Cyclotella_meneghiniana.AAC.1